MTQRLFRLLVFAVLTAVTGAFTLLARWAEAGSILETVAIMLSIIGWSLVLTAAGAWIITRLIRYHDGLPR